MMKTKWFFGGRLSWTQKALQDNSNEDVLKALENGTGNTLYLLNNNKIISILNAETILRKFACLCALDVAHLWNPPEIVLRYLNTQDESIRDAARDAAWDAAWDAARDAATSAAWYAARDAARDAARGAARDAARSAAWGAARDAAWGAQRKRLEGMLLEGIKESKSACLEVV